MRIPDIIAEHTAPGAAIIDLTPEPAGLASYLALPASFGTSYRRALAGGDAAVAVVARTLPTGSESGGFTLEVGKVATRTVHVVFFAEPADVTAVGLLEQAARAGLELYTTHFTMQPPYRFAVVLGPERAPTGASAATRLRMVNQARFGELVVRLREEELERARARVEKVDQLERRLEAARIELSAIKDAMKAERAERAEIERALAVARRRLAAVRGALSFRIGRATTVALRKARVAPLAVPGLFLATLRGEDELLAGDGAATDDDARDE
jgi:hypothetical protein